MTIVSFAHDYLFLKTRKVAGSSVEAMLRTCTGPDDIVSPLTPKDEQFCALRGLDARNYARNPADESRYRALVLAGDFPAALAFNRQLDKRYGAHMSAATLVRRLGRRDFSRLFRFTIERNPFTWLVSIAAHDTQAYNTGAGGVPDVGSIRQRMWTLLSRRRRLRGSNYTLYTVRGSLAVDRVLRFEHLEEELTSMLRELGISPSLPLPSLKTGPVLASLAELYTPELEAAVVDRYRPVFELMGYPERLAEAEAGGVSGAAARRSTDRSMSPRTGEPAGRPRTSGPARPEPG